MTKMRKPKTDILGRTDLQKKLEKTYSKIVDLVSENRQDEAIQLFNKLNDGRKRYFLDKLSKADEHVMCEYWQVETYKLISSKYS